MNLGLEASIATEMGPISTMAAFNANSSPFGTKPYPEQLAARYWALYLHGPRWKGDKLFILVIKKWVKKTVELKLSWIVSDSYLAYVGIGCIRVYAVILHNILETVWHEATIAPTVAVFYSAVYKVLRTQGHQDTCSLLKLPFQSANCTEGPTRATVTLWIQELFF